MSNVIEIKNLSKKYKDFYAVDHVSLTIKKGSIFGLIGQNGAGKSTLMKMIAGMIHESEGEIRLFGHLPKEDAFLYRRIGTLIETAGLYPNLNAYDNIKLKAMALGCDQEENIQSLLALCGLLQAGKKKVKNFSMGMKQRLGIAVALLAHPEVLILDEPTNGLDPQGIQDIRNLLQELNQKQQMSIIISSHILEELSKIASDYAIIKNGKIIDCFTREELGERCKDCLYVRVDDANRGIVYLEEAQVMQSYEVLPNDVIQLYESDEDTSKIAQILIQNGIKLYEMYEQKQDLESYFLKKSGDEHA